MPAMHAPGEDVDGVCHYRPLHSERAQPGAILVDRTGRALRRRGPELRRRGSGHAERRCGPRRSALPGRAVLVGVRRRLSPPLPGGPSRTGRPRPAVAGARRRPGRAGAGHRCPGGRTGADGDTLQRRGAGAARTRTSAGARFPTTVGSETRAPLTRRWHRCARPPSTPWRSISAAWGPRVDRAPTITAGCCRRAGPGAGALRGGQRGRQPVRDGDGRGRRHTRARPRVRLPGRRGGGGGPVSTPGRDEGDDRAAPRPSPRCSRGAGAARRRDTPRASRPAGRRRRAGTDLGRPPGSLHQPRRARARGREGMAAGVADGMS